MRGLHVARVSRTHGVRRGLVNGLLNGVLNRGSVKNGCLRLGVHVNFKGIKLSQQTRITATFATDVRRHMANHPTFFSSLNSFFRRGLFYSSSRLFN